MYAATAPEMRASSAPVMSVTGCEYTPMLIGRVELLHHRERIVVAPDDLHAEHALGRRAKNGCGHRHGDDRGQCRDRGDFSDAAGQC